MLVSIFISNGSRLQIVIKNTCNKLQKPAHKNKGDNYKPFLTITIKITNLNFTNKEKNIATGKKMNNTRQQ